MCATRTQRVFTGSLGVGVHSTSPPGLGFDPSLAAARRQETVTSWAAAGHSPKEPEPTAGALAGGKP
jgi:hypothetical protein